MQVQGKDYMHQYLRNGQSREKLHDILQDANMLFNLYVLLYRIFLMRAEMSI